MNISNHIVINYGVGKYHLSHTDAYYTYYNLNVNSLTQLAIQDRSPTRYKVKRTHTLHVCACMYLFVPRTILATTFV